jgi:2-succinyl-5-enolpyruvyl-6-hydroxy-3-cyclohexene-1-carboxylate synthase
MALTPLVILSADRPAELRGLGANQTIDQTRLYGDKVRHFSDFPAPDSGGDHNDLWRSKVCEALSRALGREGRPGPVHLNLAFREPTVPVTDDGRTRGEPYPYSAEGREGGGRWTDFSLPEPGSAEISAEGPVRGLVIAGDGHYDRADLVSSAEALGFPVLATALSGLRGAAVVSGYHLLLSKGVPEALHPELVIGVGSLGPSRRLDALVSAAGTRARIDYWGRTIDPHRDATHRLQTDPVATLRTLVGQVRADPGWEAVWHEAEGALEMAVAEFLAGSAAPTGASVARSLNKVPWDALVVAS